MFARKEEIDKNVISLFKAHFMERKVYGGCGGKKVRTQKFMKLKPST